MSEENNNEEEKQTAKDELETASINGIAYILTHLADHYGNNIPDDIELNNVFLRVFSNLTGEMLAHYPEDIRDDVFSNMISDIQQIMDVAVVELAELAELEETLVEAEESDVQTLADTILRGSNPLDLSKLKPKGNC